MELLSGGEIVIRALKDAGVKYIWGYPGGAALHIYDALFQQTDVQHILVRHEQAAVHAADGHSRSTGEVGAVLVTSGPCATNAITGIATAYMDSIPLVVISGQVAREKIGEDAFQETDMVGISRPIVKHSFLVKDATEIAGVIAKAFFIAGSGRPGPVVVDIPKDVTDPNHRVPYEYPEKVKIRSYQPTSKGHSGQIKRAIKTLLGAKRPIIYSGGGVIMGEASSQLTELARLINAPVTNTLMGLGAFPGSDPQFVGMLGIHGTFEANTAMHHADVILAVGARFDDRVTNTTGKFALPQPLFTSMWIPHRSPKPSKRISRLSVPAMWCCGRWSISCRTVASGRMMRQWRTGGSRSMNGATVTVFIPSPAMKPVAVTLSSRRMGRVTNRPPPDSASALASARDRKSVV